MDFQVNGSENTKNNKFVLILFWFTILFQLTAFKFIWSLENIARVINLVLLIILIFYALKVVGTEYFNKNIWAFYYLPGILIVAGLFTNISINVIYNLKLVTFYGQILPWALYLIIPSLLKKRNINSETLWNYFYNFMLLVNVLGMIEYIIVFSGANYLKVLSTPNGLFLGGKFSLFYLLPGNIPYYRYYSCFLEPGTLAMFLLPALCYSFFYKRYFGLIIFLIAFLMTFSLGGVISLLILIVVISFILVNRKKSYFIIALLTLIIISSLLWLSFGKDIIAEYETKGASANTRIESFNKTLQNIPIIIKQNPLGLKLAEDTKSFKKNKLYLGSNFIPGTYLQYGGISAFVGYIICLLVSFSISLKTIVKSTAFLEEKVVFSSLLVLLPFIIQRTTIWETALFSFLFAPTIIRTLERRRV